MAMKVWLLSLLLFAATFAKESGFARFDEGAGTVRFSTFTGLHLINQQPQLTFEVAATNYYSFSPFEYDQRLITSDWGALWSHSMHRWAVNFSYFDQFSLIKEYSPQFSYGLSPTEWLALSSKISFTQLVVSFDHDTEYSVQLGIGVFVKKMTFGYEYALEHLSPEPERSIPMGKMRFVVSLKETKIGSQAIAIHWNHTDKSGYLALTQSYNLSSWFNIALSMRSEPFQLGLSSTFEFGKVSSGFLFARHIDLGWSHTGAVQIKPTLAQENHSYQL